MVCKRLRWRLEKENLIASTQFGSRNMRSTTDFLVSLESDVCDAFAMNEHLLLVPLDVEKAYEMGWVNRGSVLSVLLFIIAINEALEIISIYPYINGRLFVDDFSLTLRGTNIDVTIKIMQHVLNKLLEWSETRGFKLSKTKSEYMLFKRSQDINHEPLMLYNQPMKKVPQLKILGLIFDSKLKHAAIIYDSANKKTLKILDSIQNNALRIALGAFRTSPTTTLEAEANIPPLVLRRKELCLRYVLTASSNPNNPAC
ncbi:GSCOCG00011352001-RA-CDS [Cotesia congregata]|nr:GSCOCG00011352001-RA-CDS [Cotesia congregata]